MKLKQIVRQRLSPLYNPQFRRLFSVQLISMIGNWMQELAKSWIIINMMGKASAVGAVLFASAIPSLIFSGLGGVVADRKSVRDILVLTQILLAVLAFALGLMVLEIQIQFWHLLVFAVLEGTIIAFDFPAFSKIIPSLVPREELQQAMAINSVTFHLSRVIGPTIAGIIMSVWSPAGVFFINAISFIGIVAVLIKMKLSPLTTQNPQAVGAGRPKMREAIRYVWQNDLLKRIYIQMALVTGLLFPLIFTSFRLYFQHKFNLSAEKFGSVFAVPGVGALLGSLTFLIWNPKNPMKVLPFSISGLVLLLTALSFAEEFSHALIILVFFSYCMFLSLAGLNVTMQLKIEHHMRGRVGALVGSFFVSVAPLMSVPVGIVTDIIGPVSLFRWTAAIFAIGSLLLVRKKDHAI